MTKLLVKCFIKNSDDIKNTKVRTEYGVFSGIVGILMNILLFVGKFIAGTIASSIAITADAFNNLSDAGSSIFTLIGFKVAGKPADDEHPFGHGRAEYATGFIISVIIILMGIEVGKSSFTKIIHPSETAFSYLVLGIMIASICVKVWLFFFNRKLSRIIDSSTMRATAQDSLNDCISTTAVIAGILIGKFTGLKIDGYIGIVVACFILITGFSTAKGMLDQLIGEAPDKSYVDGIKDYVLSQENIMGVHDIIVHSYGANRSIVSLHAEVPGDMDVFEIHEIIDDIENELNSKFNCQAVIHMDPLATDDETVELYEIISRIVFKIDNHLTIHDFRVVNAISHTNIIFDVVVPFNFRMKNDEVKQQICKAVREYDKTFNVILHVDMG